MTAWPSVPLGDIFDIARGGSPRPIDQFITEDPDGINWVMIGDASNGTKYITRTKKRIKPNGAARSRRVNPGDFLLTNSMSFGRPYIMQTSGCIHDGWLVLSPRRAAVDADYFYHLLGSQAVYSEFARLAAGATVKNLNIELVRGVQVKLPPVAEQRRIAAILDQADALRVRRRAALALLDEMARAIFVEMFGDPATNRKRLPMIKLGDLAVRFSDGPFGSNIKSCHYAERGVRVIRLQNIGVGEFIDDDRAFIDEAHFQALARHECNAGDVLVGTLGDPNLRACIQPIWLERAVNKADCVQIRPDPSRVTGEYLETLLNHPSTERMAQSRIVGQTRLRISMGRLREMAIPVPPLTEQQIFAANVAQVRRIRDRATRARLALGALFASLQHRAFRGEL